MPLAAWGRKAVLIMCARVIHVLFILAGLCTQIMGCTRYSVGVTSYLADDVPFPAASESTLIAVVTESDPKEPLLEKEVKRKVEYLLEMQGFEVGSVGESDYVLTAFISIDDGTTGTGTRSVYHAGGVSYTHVYTSNGQWATATTQNPGYTTHHPYSFTFFTRYLGLDLYERERWIRSQENEITDAIAWRATSISSGSSSDLRSAIDYLLVPAFEHFGEDTGKRKRTTLFEGDNRVKQLRESYKRDSGG